MVSLEAGIIVLGDKKEKIVKFEVWFLTQVGLHPTLAEALSTCRELGVNPIFELVSVPVAIGEGTLVEALRTV